jgi:hypothetical protein
MKKLIPALVLLLVSAMVLSTSSYAWFSMNRTVKATGMSLTSTAPANLLISNSAKAVWGSTAASNEGYTGLLYPASTTNGSTFFAIADSQILASGIGGVAGAETKFLKDSDQSGTKVVKISGANAGYWAEYTLYFKTTGSSNLDVYLDSIDITSTYSTVTLAAGVDFTNPSNQIYYVRTGAGTTEDPYVYTLQTSGVSSATTYYTKNTIDDCVRVAIFDGTTLIGIYDAGTQDTVDPVASVGNTSDNDTYTLNGSDVKVDMSSEAARQAAKFVVAGGEVEKTIVVRVWIEGQNSKCVNSIAGQNFNVGLTFKTITQNP